MVQTRTQDRRHIDMITYGLYLFVMLAGIDNDNHAVLCLFKKEGNEQQVMIGSKIEFFSLIDKNASPFFEDLGKNTLIDVWLHIVQQDLIDLPYGHNFEGLLSDTQANAVGTVGAVLERTIERLNNVIRRVC